MRTECKVAGQEVVAVCMQDVEFNLPHPIDVIKKGISKSGIGLINIAKDFLKETANDSKITRYVNEKSRKCVVIFLRGIKEHQRERLKEGMFGFLTVHVVE